MSKMEWGRQCGGYDIWERKERKMKGNGKSK